MPERLFSKIRLCEIKDLLRNVRRPSRIDTVLNRKRRKRDAPCIMVHRRKDEADLRWDTDHKVHPTLGKLLRDKKSLAAFRSFLRSEFSDENIEFWLACEKFRAAASTDDLRWKAEQIYEEFIRPSSGREINVDQHIREKIRDSLKEPTAACFDEAQRHVYLLMERDSCPRFLLSEAYLSLQRKSRSLWYI